MLSRAANWISDAITPPVCAACDQLLQYGDRHLCRLCWRDLHRACGIQYCRRCGDTRGPHLLIDGFCANCRDRKPGVRDFDGFSCVGAYEGPLREITLRFKQRFTYDAFLGELLNASLEATSFCNDVDFWIPIPSHWLRRIRRGFQPTGLLADSIARRRQGIVHPVLRMARMIPEFHRIRITPSARSRVIQGAFNVTSPAIVADKSVCLIDDVSTTGATLREATHTLKRAGAARVFVATLARTPSENEPNALDGPVGRSEMIASIEPSPEIGKS